MASQSSETLFARAWRRFAIPVLTPQRIWFAFIVAVVTDAVQILLGPLGWVFADEILDMIAMILTSAALGFHMLLLPTFVIEFIPGPDMLPTWTACTAAVVALRKRAQRTAPPPAASPPILERPANVSSVKTVEAAPTRSSNSSG